MTFPFFTSGGLFYWQDKHVFAGWKIQENIWSHRCRILDSFNICRYAGTFAKCQKKFDFFVKNWELTAPSGEAVVIVPGLLQRKKSFERLIKELESLSFEVIFVSLPMFRFDVRQKAAALNKILAQRTDIKKIHFIAAGTGGLVLRQAYAESAFLQSKTGRSILMSVPNNGFSWAQQNGNKRLYNMIFGNMAPCLLPAYAKKIPLMTGEFATLNGGLKEEYGLFFPFFSKNGVLNGCDAYHPNAKVDFLIPDSLPFFLPNNPKTIDICKQFIRYGYSNKKRNRKNHSVMNIFED